MCAAGGRSSLQNMQLNRTKRSSQHPQLHWKISRYMETNKLHPHINHTQIFDGILLYSKWFIGCACTSSPRENACTQTRRFVQFFFIVCRFDSKLKLELNPKAGQYCRVAKCVWFNAFCRMYHSPFIYIGFIWSHRWQSTRARIIDKVIERDRLRWKIHSSACHIHAVSSARTATIRENITRWLPKEPVSEHRQPGKNNWMIFAFRIAFDLWHYTSTMFHATVRASRRIFETNEIDQRHLSCQLQIYNPS